MPKAQYVSNQINRPRHYNKIHQHTNPPTTGSLLSYLKRQGLANALAAGFTSEMGDFALYDVRRCTHVCAVVLWLLEYRIVYIYERAFLLPSTPQT